MKKNFLMMGLLVLGLGLTAVSCGDDDDDNPNPNTEQQGTPDDPAVTPATNIPDYSEAVGITINSMIRQYGEPAMTFGNYYLYTMEDDGPVESLMFAVNSENMLVYAVTEVLAEDAYEAEDLQAYFASKYTLYGKEELPVYDDDDNEIGKTEMATYGNAENVAEATLTIVVNGNSSVIYTNPQNTPEEIGLTELPDIAPIEAAEMFIGESLEDIMDEYEGIFMEIAPDAYMAMVAEGGYVESITLNVVDGIVASVSFEYGVNDEELIAYYEKNGYTCTKTGDYNEDGYQYSSYTFVNEEEGVYIECTDSRGTVTYIAD